MDAFGVGDRAGVGRWGRGRVQEVDLKAWRWLTLDPSPRPQTPLTNSEESLDFSVSLEQVRAWWWSWEGAAWPGHQGLSQMLSPPPTPGVHGAGAQGWEAAASTSPGHLPQPHPRPEVPPETLSVSGSLAGLLAHLLCFLLLSFCSRHLGLALLPAALGLSLGR